MSNNSREPSSRYYIIHVLHMKLLKQRKVKYFEGHKYRWDSWIESKPFGSNSHAHNWVHEPWFIFSTSWWLKTASLARASVLDSTSLHLNVHWISLIKCSPGSSNSVYIIETELNTYLTSFAWVSYVRERCPSQSY